MVFGMILFLCLSGCSKKSTVSGSFSNNAPTAPANPIPSDSARGQLINPIMTWTCSDPDGDSLSYDLYFGISHSPPLVHQGHPTTLYLPDTLQINQTYYWKIVARDQHDQTTVGPVWQFTTITHLPGDMVLVSGGSFQMGSDSQAVSQPIHTVTLPAFYIDVFEVTNGQYRAFCDSTNRNYPLDPGYRSLPDYFTNREYDNYPVVMLSWADAKAYAEWVGKRLPTEAEWERAAKGNVDNRQYPWGDVWVPYYANFAFDYDGFAYTAPVGSFPHDIGASGCLDIIGNASEWCEDDWHEDYNYAPSNGTAWTDTPRGSYRVWRGGCSGSFPAAVRCSYRSYWYPLGCTDFVGFRCAKTP
jgi:formylglycine-generating enzyme required for sulfatase activity